MQQKPRIVQLDFGKKISALRAVSCLFLPCIYPYRDLFV